MSQINQDKKETNTIQEARPRIDKNKNIVIGNFKLERYKTTSQHWFYNNSKNAYSLQILHKNGKGILRMFEVYETCSAQEPCLEKEFDGYQKAVEHAYALMKKGDPSKIVEKGSSLSLDS